MDFAVGGLLELIVMRDKENEAESQTFERRRKRLFKVPRTFSVCVIFLVFLLPSKPG